MGMKEELPLRISTFLLVGCLSGLVRPAAYSLNMVHFFNFSGKTKLLVVVLGLVSVEDAPSNRFARYERNTNILTCLWLNV